MKRLLSALVIGFLLSLPAKAQNNQPWNGKSCAVVLTYDDATDQQLDNAVPVLDTLGLKATFYITAFFKFDADQNECMETTGRRRA